LVMVAIGVVLNGVTAVETPPALAMGNPVLPEIVEFTPGAFNVAAGPPCTVMVFDPATESEFAAGLFTTPFIPPGAAGFVTAELPVVPVVVPTEVAPVVPAPGAGGASRSIPGRAGSMICCA
jgi:hypothetical protein